MKKLKGLFNKNKESNPAAKKKKGKALLIGALVTGIVTALNVLSEQVLGVSIPIGLVVEVLISFL